MIDDNDKNYERAQSTPDAHVRLWQSLQNKQSSSLKSSDIMSNTTHIGSRHSTPVNLSARSQRERSIDSHVKLWQDTQNQQASQLASDPHNDNKHSHKKGKLSK